jgi:solute carrier family 35 protein C2
MSIFTGPRLAVSLQVFRAPSTHEIAKTLSFVLFGSSLAFMLTVSEYLLLANTSSITLAIAGIFKVRFNGVVWDTCLQ